MLDFQPKDDSIPYESLIQYQKTRAPMKRMIDHHLENWKVDLLRKPLLIRGARQIGKTYAVRQLGKAFDHFIEINFERMPEIHSIFD